MTDGAALVAASRRRLSDVDTDALNKMWESDGRTEWAETALREELLERGAHIVDLDFIAKRRAQIAANAPPLVRDTLWFYGVVGRLVTVVTVLLWVSIVHAVHGPGSVLAIGIVVVLGIYVQVLTRRTISQRNHPLSTSASFVMYWQLGEAWVFLIGTIIATAFTVAG